MEWEDVGHVSGELRILLDIRGALHSTRGRRPSISTTSFAPVSYQPFASLNVLVVAFTTILRGCEVLRPWKIWRREEKIKMAIIPYLPNPTKVPTYLMCFT